MCIGKRVCRNICQHGGSLNGHQKKGWKRSGDCVKKAAAAKEVQPISDRVAKNLEIILVQMRGDICLQVHTN